MQQVLTGRLRRRVGLKVDPRVIDANQILPRVNNGTLKHSSEPHRATKYIRTPHSTCRQYCSTDSVASTLICTLCPIVHPQPATCRLNFCFYKVTLLSTQSPAMVRLGIFLLPLIASYHCLPLSDKVTEYPHIVELRISSTIGGDLQEGSLAINLSGPNGNFEVPLTTDPSTVFARGKKMNFSISAPIAVDSINKVSLKWTKKNFLFSDFLYPDRIVIKPGYLQPSDQGYTEKSFCGRQEMKTDEWTEFSRSC